MEPNSADAAGIGIPFLPSTCLMRFLLLSALLLCVSAIGPVCVGQDDSPFDVSVDDIFGPSEDEAQVEQNEEQTERPSPLASQLMEHAGRGNMPLAEAIESLARIGRWSDVDRLMAVAGSRNLSEAEAAAMVNQIGPSVLLRIKLNDQISDAARAAADKLGKAATAHAESPDRLRRAIDHLDASSVDARLGAARTLLAGGNTAVTELVAAAVSETPPAPRDEILRTLIRLGEGGRQSLVQLALYGQPKVRLRATESLARIDRKGAVPELVTALHATDSSSDEKESAAAILRQMSPSLPSREASVAALYRELKRLQTSARQTPNDGRIKRIWSINANRSAVNHHSTPLVMSAYRDVADMAARLRRIGQLPPSIDRAVFAADMSYRLMVDPDWGDDAQIQSVRAAFGSVANGASLSAAIGDSIQENDHPALIGLLRMIEADASPLQRTLLLQSGGPAPTPLVAAASSHDPRVRYESALAASRLAGDAPYTGSSDVKKTLGEMQSLGRAPLAILVETRPDVIVEQETLLRELGLDVEVVGTVAQLQRAVERGGDLRLILSKTELVDFAAIEMIDLVRRSNRGHNVPIVLFGAPIEGLQSERWSAPAVLVERPASTAAFATLMEEIDRMRRLPPLTAIDRQLYRHEATQLLAAKAPSR